MPDNLAFHHIHDEFAHIGGVVSDPLVILTDERQTDRPRDGPWIFQHEGDEFPEELFRKVVDKVIVPTDFSRQVGITAAKGAPQNYMVVVRARVRRGFNGVPAMV